MGSRMRCHYEVLGVERSVDADALKKAYRKLALRLHPDKNRDDIEGAEARFKELNSAYEVLSDPQERAWYDDHRESILAGGDGTAGEGAVSVTPNLWKWFRASCFDGFGDDPEGFYAVYAAAFQEILKTETDSGAKGGLPEFGNSVSPLDEVERFYSVWDNFVSGLSFGWADLYNPNEVASNRYQRRIVAKENQKARSTAKRAYNEQVRSLVNYVKKRDKRVMVLEQERARERERRETERLQAQEDRKKERANARAEWFKRMAEEEARIAAEEEETGQKVFRLAEDAGQASDDSHDEEDDHDLVWVCEVCSKNFKSEKQFHNHEKSKKHAEAMKKLRRKLQEEEKMLRKLEEEELLMREIEEQEAAEAERQRAESEAGDAAAGSASAKADAEVDETNDGAESSDDSSETESDDESDSDVDFGAFGRLNVASSDDDEEDDENDDDDDDDDDDDEDDDEDKKKEVKDLGHGEGDSEEAEEEEADTNAADAAAKGEGNVPIAEDGASPPPAPTTGKKGGKARKKKNGGVAGAGNGPAPVAEQTDHLCAVCTSYFASRNQLFKHIQKTGHAVAPDQVPQDTGAGGGKGKKKKKKGGNRRG